MQLLSTLDIIQGRKQVDLLLNLVVPLSRCYCWVEFAGCPSPTRCGGVTLPLSVVRWHAVGSPLQWPVSCQPASIAVGGDDAINNRSASSFFVLCKNNTSKSRAHHRIRPHHTISSTLFRAARTLHRRRQSVPHSRRPSERKIVRLPLSLSPCRDATHDHLDLRVVHMSLVVTQSP